MPRHYCAWRGPAASSECLPTRKRATLRTRQRNELPTERLPIGRRTRRSYSVMLRSMAQDDKIFASAGLNFTEVTVSWPQLYFDNGALRLWSQMSTPSDDVANKFLE